MSETEKGFCGDGILWCLDRTTGQMTISGSGPMADYESEKEVPWYSLKDEITEVSILDGVTTVKHTSEKISFAGICGDYRDICIW